MHSLGNVSDGMRAVGRPRHKQQLAGLTVILTNEHIAFLDEVTRGAQRGHRRALNRSSILRAVLAAVLASGLTPHDLAGIQEEELLAEAIKRRMVDSQIAGEARSSIYSTDRS